MQAINFNPFPELSTDRLLLRQLTPADAWAIYDLRADERLSKYISRKACKTTEEAAAFIERITNGIAKNETLYWGVILKTSGKLIGTSCMWNISADNRRAEIGYEMSVAYQGKGLMREAVTAVVKYGFEVLQLHSLEAFVNPENAPSVNLLGRLGFVKEAHFKDYTFFDGSFRDMAVYSIINANDQLYKN
jgi:ribosomal-protein-alanine N-acetyltransferase